MPETTTADESEDASDDTSYAMSETDLEPEFRTIVSFVADYLSPLLRRRLNRSIALWCPSWWRHPEALVRLTVLWHTFEELRLEGPVGLSTWWLHHADPHLALLMDPDRGPFAVCDPRDGHNEMELEPLPLDPPPAALLDHPAFNRDAVAEDS